MTREETQMRTKMMAKLFALYPGRSDPEMTMAAYLERTRDVPALALSHALHRLTRRPGTWVPDVGSIRQEAARWLRENYRRAQGRDPHEHNPALDPGDEHLDVERWLARGPEVLALAESAQTRLRLGIGPAQSKATAEERERGAKLLERAAASLGTRMQVPR